MSFKAEQEIPATGTEAKSKLFYCFAALQCQVAAIYVSAHIQQPVYSSLSLHKHFYITSQSFKSRFFFFFLN